jgi:hypothetical protein
MKMNRQSITGVTSIAVLLASVGIAMSGITNADGNEGGESREHSGEHSEYNIQVEGHDSNSNEHGGWCQPSESSDNDGEGHAESQDSDGVVHAKAEGSDSDVNTSGDSDGCENHLNDNDGDGAEQEGEGHDSDGAGHG